MQTNNLLSKTKASSNFSSVEWLNNQALNRQQANKSEEAIAFYLEAIELNINQPEWVYANLIVLLGKTKHFDETKQIEKLALNIYPQSSEVYRSLGENAQENQDPDRSITCFKQALEINFNQPDWVYQILAEDLFQKQEISSCIDLAKQGLKLHPDCHSLHSILQKSEHNNIDSSINDPEILLETNSLILEFNEVDSGYQEIEKEEVEVLLNIPNLIKTGDALFDDHDYANALIEYEQVLSVEEDNYHSLLRIGECSFRLGEYGKAEKTLTHLLKDTPQSFWALVCLGEAYFEQAKFDLAIETLERALLINQDNVWAAILVGKSYRSLGNIEKAIASFQQVIAKQPNQDIGYINLAEVYNQLKQVEEAQKNWLKVIEINSHHKWATISLGYSYISQKQIEIAEDFFVAKKDLFANDFDFVFAFAHVYITKMEWQEAETMMTQASGLNPYNNEVKVRLLELCLYSGNLDRAYEQYLSLRDRSDNIPTSFYQAAAKLFSEQKEWDLAFEYAKKSVIIESSNIHNHKLFIKTVRKSKKFQEALDFLLDPTILNDQNNNTILYLRIAIQEQLLKSIPEAQKVLLSDKIGLGSASKQVQLLQKRLRIKENIFDTSPAVNSQLQTEIFYCTDLGYSLPTLVSIYSLYKNNKHQLKGKTIYVVANQKTISVVSKTYQKLADKFEFKIELIDIGSLVKESIDNKLNTSYGVFTGGDSLSSTAYYRLFFSQFLREYGSCSSWLYIDSDTLIINSIKDIDKLNLLGLPIAARQESLKPEVQKTIEKNGLQYGKYFNSGVIAFNAQHPLLSQLATKAVSVAMNEGHRLLYHDQCALNIAFDGQIANLGTQFNDYYPPSDTRNIEELRLSSDSVILHLLDRPKPWDTLSYHKGSIIWFKMLEEISSFIPSNYILELFQLLQNTL